MWFTLVFSRVMRKRVLFLKCVLCLENGVSVCQVIFHLYCYTAAFDIQWEHMGLCLNDVFHILGALKYVQVTV